MNTSSIEFAIKTILKKAHTRLEWNKQMPPFIQHFMSYAPVYGKVFNRNEQRYYRKFNHSNKNGVTFV